MGREQQQASQSPPEWLKRSEALEMANQLESEALQPVGATRWLVPYADMVTLVLGLLFVLFGYQLEENKSLKARLNTQPSAMLAVEDTVSKEKLDALRLELETLRLQLLEMEAELNETKALPEQVNVTADTRGMILSLDNELLFNSGEAQLTPLAKQALGSIAEVLKRHDAPIRIEGHTDDTPIHTALYPSNWELSTQRATSILRALVNDHGVPASQLSAAGYAEFRPIAENSTVQGKRKNRRVDIVIMEGQWAQTEPVALESSSDTEFEAKLLSQPPTSEETATAPMTSVEALLTQPIMQ